MTIRTENVDELARKLARSLVPHLRLQALVLANEIVNRVAPYPTQRPPRNTNRWYERGFGYRYRTRSGEVRGNKTSETMNRRWDVQSQGLGAVAQNLASYSGWVHTAAYQTKIHAQTGWRIDEAVVSEMQRDGTLVRHIETAIRNGLGDLVE